MTPDAAILALVVAFAIIVGIVVAVVRKHRQRRIFGASLRRDQIAAERKAKIAEIRQHVIRRERRIH